MDSTQPLSPFCIYTLRHTSELEEVLLQGGDGEFKENRKWKTGKQLFLQAQRDGLLMPLLFAAAETEVGSGLIYVAALRDIEINDINSTTMYRFSDLKKLKNNPPLDSLKLKKTNQPLSNNFIRPYAICYTPALLWVERSFERVPLVMKYTDRLGRTQSQKCPTSLSMDRKLVSGLPYPHARR